MDYAAQDRFFTASKLWSMGVLLLFAAGAAVAIQRYSAGRWLNLLCIAVLLAVAASLVYTPDYLHLTVYPGKRVRWAARVRWPIIAAVFLLSLPFISTRSFVPLLLSVGWLTLANLLIGLFPVRFSALYALCADFLLLNILVLYGHLNLLVASALFAAAAHLCIVIAEKRAFAIAFAASCIGFGVLFEGAIVIAIQSPGSTHLPAFSGILALGAPVIVSAFGAAFLVQRASRRNRQNVAPVMAGLVEFTGYTPTHIEHLMAISDAELAAKWKAAGIAPDDATRMADWYRENSELYLFALLAFNLDYKRIRYYLRILPFAKGACLDYGAGNGELLIELARRGHAVTYYDVDGLTMKYARFRAQAEDLKIAFFSDKESLAAAAKTARFDTIFSLDVLEHLPDLAGELGFLTSVLNRTGSLIFNLPPGSTKTHPMHLTHDLDVRRFLTEKKFVERTMSRFGKGEMYFFTRSSSVES